MQAIETSPLFSPSLRRQPGTHPCADSQQRRMYGQTNPEKLTSIPRLQPAYGLPAYPCFPDRYSAFLRKKSCPDAWHSMEREQPKRS